MVTAIGAMWILEVLRARRALVEAAKTEFAARMGCARRVCAAMQRVHVSEDGKAAIVRSAKCTLAGQGVSLALASTRPAVLFAMVTEHVATGKRETQRALAMMDGTRQPIQPIARAATPRRAVQTAARVRVAVRPPVFAADMAIALQAFTAMRRVLAHPVGLVRIAIDVRQRILVSNACRVRALQTMAAYAAAQSAVFATRD